MTYFVEWSELALMRLEQVYDWIAESNPEAARKVTEQLLEKAEQLEQFPKLGRLYPNSPEPNIRELLVGRYRLVYELLEEEQRVSIWHTATIA